MNSDDSKELGRDEKEESQASKRDIHRPVPCRSSLRIRSLARVNDHDLRRSNSAMDRTQISRLIVARLSRLRQRTPAVRRGRGLEAMVYRDCEFQSAAHDGAGR